ncbi:MAG: sulfurtransferase-like selenium metabolism protein YedF [Fretibacterium sp.]|nr:sulfurtransferase-like selenium metabolism protein YedF [Fretibacterium sp.]
MTVVNAVGKACPEPVIMTKAALEKGASEIEVHVDNAVAASNVKRFLEKAGFAVQLQDEDGNLTVKGTKEAQALSTESPVATAAAPVPQASNVPQTLSILIAHQILGGDDRELGEILIKSFLGTLSKLSPLPSVVALMNDGVKLALFDSSTCDYLKDLEQKGTTILVCGTCTNHFGITENVGVGTISNMFEIVEALTGVDKILSL